MRPLFLTLVTVLTALTAVPSTARPVPQWTDRAAAVRIAPQRPTVDGRSSTGGRTAQSTRDSASARYGTGTPSLERSGPPGVGEVTCGVFQQPIAGVHRGKRAPALAVYRGELHLVTQFDTACDAIDTPVFKHICSTPTYPLFHYVFADGAWGPRTRIPDQFSKKGVALAAFGNHLHMVHLGNESNDVWHSTYDGRSWSRNVRVAGQRSKRRPAMAVYGNALHMVHLGDSSNDIWHSRYVPGRGWTVNRRVPGQRSNDTPALAVYAGRLHMVHTGDSTNRLWHSVYARGTWSRNVLLPGIESRYAPTLAFSATPQPWLELVSHGNHGLRHSLFGRPRGRSRSSWFDSRSLADIESDSSTAVAFFEGCWHMVSVKDDKLIHTTFATRDLHPGR